MSGTVFIGIDPGSSSGGIAAINGDSVNCIKLESATEADIRDFLISVSENMVAKCVIEKVGPARGRDGRRQGVSSAFKFGHSYGLLRGIVTALRIPFDEVPPVVWQRAMSCLSRGDKKVTKAAAERLFPSLKITHATADAMLLADYCRRTQAARYRVSAG